MEWLKIELRFKVQMDNDSKPWGEKKIIMLPGVRHICLFLNIVTFICSSIFDIHSMR